MKRASLLLGLFLMANVLACYHDRTKEVIVERQDRGGWHHDHDWHH